MITYSEPVTGNNFFAREDLTASLVKNAKDIKEGYRHNTAIIGRGLIGKSSLLLQFLNTIKDDDGLVPIYINLNGIGFVEFATGFMTMLLYHSLKRTKKLKRQESLDYLSDCAKSVFPKSYDLIKKIRALIDEKNDNEAFSALWDLCVVINSESKKFPVVVLDEFDMISSFALKNPFQVLGQKIMVQQKTLFILSSSSTITAKKILSEKLSLLFGGFKILDIGPFTVQQAKDLLRQQCKAIDIPDELKDFIINFTGGHPFYLTSIIQKLHFAKRYGVDKISARQLSQLIAEIMFSQGGVINQFFSYLLEQIKISTAYNGLDIFEILKSLTSTTKTADLIKKSIISHAQISSLLDSLLELGLISKNGSLCALTDICFKTWIEIKAKPKNLHFDFIPHGSEIDYTKEIEERITRFRTESKKGLDEKVTELVRSFDNDKFFIDERMRILPHLEFIQQKNLDANNISIITQGKKRWVFVIPNKKIAEEDIYNIIDRVKDTRGRCAKIVLIAAFDIDTAAKLLAKQRHLWVWNKDDIRMLFEFYKGYNAITA